jgi:hypothetical protein
MLSRARDPNDLLRLLASRQLDMALVREPDAAAAAAGAPGAAGAGVALRSVAQVGAYLLVCRADFPSVNAYRVAEAVAEGWSEIVEPGAEAAGPRPPPSARVAPHPGATEYWGHHPGSR